MPRLVLGLLPVLMLLFPLATQAQTGGAQSSSTVDRLFLSFIEDTVLAERQWWEAQIEFVDGDVVDQTVVRGVAAFQPWSRVGVGGRIGFGSTDAPAGIEDGSGATDLDLWAKYRFGDGSASTEFAVGGVATIPFGDDTAGLGFDAFSVSAFGALRHDLERGVLAAHAGVRFNGDGQISGGPEMDGEVSAMIGGAWIVPLSDRFTVLGEIDFEDERFAGRDSDVRVLGGINWRIGRESLLRGAIALGLTDDAPDVQLILGYAATF